MSSFPVTFTLVSEVDGVTNKNKMTPFTLVPGTATIKAGGDYQVKLLFQPDHPANYYFSVLLIDIPNQVKPKSIYARGWCYSRQLFVREYEPFEWKDKEKLRKKYEDPLKMLSSQGAVAQNKQRILLEFAREEDQTVFNENQFEKEKTKYRRILLGSCKLLDNKLEKNGTYEITPGVSITNNPNHLSTPIERGEQLLRV